MKVKTKIRLKRIVVILLILLYCFWVEYNDYGKAHHEVLANIRFILMILYPIYLYFDERKYKDDKSK